MLVKWLDLVLTREAAHSAVTLVIGTMVTAGEANVKLLSISCSRVGFRQDFSAHTIIGVWHLQDISPPWEGVFVACTALST